MTKKQIEKRVKNGEIREVLTELSVVDEMKTLNYENEVRKHKLLVAEHLMFCAKKLLDRAATHDDSKFDEVEMTAYVEPVWSLTRDGVEYGSEQYKELTARMGEGLRHHYANNDHHPEFNIGYHFQTNNDVWQCMDLMSLIEMLCDWTASAQRNGNNAWDAMKHKEAKFPITDQLKAVLANTLALLEVNYDTCRIQK